MARLRLLLALLGATAALSLGSTAAADCAAPDVSASPTSLSPGDTMTIEGYAWGNACNDTTGPGCDPPPLGDPIEDVRLVLRSVRGSTSFDLGTIDANDEYILRTTAEVPDVPPGVYAVEARGGDHRAISLVRISKD